MREEEVTTEIIPLLASDRASGSKLDRVGSAMEHRRKDSEQIIARHPEHIRMKSVSSKMFTKRARGKISR